MLIIKVLTSSKIQHLLTTTNVTPTSADEFARLLKFG